MLGKGLLAGRKRRKWSPEETAAAARQRKIPSNGDSGSDNTIAGVLMLSYLRCRNPLKQSKAEIQRKKNCAASNFSQETPFQNSSQILLLLSGVIRQ